MKIFADRDETACFREKRHPALLSGVSRYSLEEWRRAGVHLTSKRPSLELKSHRSPNKYFLDTVCYAATIPVTGGDTSENTLLGRTCVTGY